MNRRTCPKCFAYGYHMPWCGLIVASVDAYRAAKGKAGGS